MASLLTGSISKLKSTFALPVQYVLPIGEVELSLNCHLGKVFTLKFEQKIHCIYCQRAIKKSFNQGYCYPCFQGLARCDLCMVRPERCHYHLGTCREPEWARQHCFIPHIVYIANTSDLKVGITRETQLPNRWIDQGARQAISILKVENRYQSGLIEVQLKEKMSDKTDWRKMLMGEGSDINLLEKRERLLSDPSWDRQNAQLIENENVTHLQYPVLEYPKKIKSLNLEKNPIIEGILLGIKGQYLIFDVGVINVRGLGGYVVSVKVN